MGDLKERQQIMKQPSIALLKLISKKWWCNRGWWWVCFSPQSSNEATDILVERHVQHVPRDSNASLPRNPFIKYTFVKYRRNVNNFLPKLQHRTFRTKQFTIVSQFCFSNKGNFPWRQILFLLLNQNTNTLSWV